MMRDLADRGAQGILLGCTEIDLLVGPADAPVPLFDTTGCTPRRRRARAAVTADDPAGAGRVGDAISR